MGMIREIEDGAERVIKEMTPEKESFDGIASATRSKQDGRYDLISPHGLRALARRLKLGAERHGERNWEQGGEGFRQATMSHLMAHLASYMESPNQEDADALICNAMFLCHFEAVKMKHGDHRMTSIQQRDHLAALLQYVPDELCMERFDGNHTCVRKKGHEGSHARYGIGS